MDNAEAAANFRVPSEFGESVALDCDTAFIGASSDNENGQRSGAAYVFTRNGSVWSEAQKLVAPEALAGDAFGYSVALDSDTALIGAPTDNDDDNGDFSGSFYLFTRNGDIWSRQRKIVAADGTARDAFGTSLALDGDTALIGAPDDYDYGHVFGSAYVYDLSSTGTDGDGDGVADIGDNCPADFNPLQEDDDNDGVPDNQDLDPFDPTVGEGIETTISRSVLSTADDVEQRSSGRIAFDSSDLELVNDGGFEQSVGLRFADLAIPQGAIIQEAQRTPDLSAIVQEIVAADDWQSGNALVLLIDGTGRRNAESFNGESDSAPLLRVEYE